jgi:type IV pilus assembly protein PilQ
MLSSVSSFATTESKKDDHLSLVFSQIPVAEVLQLLANYKNLNLILSDGVSGAVSLHLHNVPWSQALDSILVMKGLTKRQQGSILMIGPHEELQNYNENLQNAQSMQNEFMVLHYAKAAEVAEIIQNKSAGLLSDKGSVTVDVRTNKIWLNDFPKQINLIHQFLKGIDTPAKQILISARLVKIDQDFVNELGIKFSGRSINGSANKQSEMETLGHLGFSIATLAHSSALDVELAALAKEGHAEIISKPELITANHQTAEIESGEEIPYQQGTSSGATNIAFKKAVLGLKVTPEITPENKIILSLKINQDQVSPLTVNGIPAINTQAIETKISVNNQETIVLGGIFEESKNSRVQSVPVLGKVPLVGKLFSSKEIRNGKKELLVFMTTQILKE